MLQQQTTASEAPQFTPSFSYETMPAQTSETAGDEAPALLDGALNEQTGEEQAHAKERVSASASALNALIKQEIRIKRRDDYIMLAWTVAFTFTMVAVTQFTVNSAAAGSAIDPTAAMKYILLLLTGMGVGTIALRIQRSHRRRTALTQELGKNHDVALIGPLIDTLNVESTPVRDLSKRALIPLLPGLHASDTVLLTDARRDRLLRLLAVSPNDRANRDLTEMFSRAADRREIDLQVAILKAFEQVGGAKELPTVERLARGLPRIQIGVFVANEADEKSKARRARGLPGKMVPAEVQQAANECLPYLQSRVSDQRASEQLLRASSVHDTTADILLRPASGQSDAAPQQLLRASELDAPEPSV